MNSKSWIKNIGAIDGILYHELKIIDVPGGNVLHAMRQSESGYAGFGEAYFSMVDFGAVKAWKRHREMTMNLLVPLGAVRFVFYDDRKGSPTFGSFEDITISSENYFRITVPPMIWFGFSGETNQKNLALNIVNLEHRPDELDRLTLDDIPYNWEIK